MVFTQADGKYYSQKHVWKNGDDERYMRVPWIESAHKRCLPWNTAHAYWIKQHHTFASMTVKECLEEIDKATATTFFHIQIVGSYDVLNSDIKQSAKDNLKAKLATGMK